MSASMFAASRSRVVTDCPEKQVGPKEAETLADGAVRTRRVPRPPMAELRGLDDNALLEWVLEGSEPGFRVFLERFRGLIVSCASKTSQRSGMRLGADELMDVLGEVSLNLVANDRRRLRLYQEGRGSSVATWVGVITTSTTLDYLRRARRHPVTPMTEEELDQLASPKAGPDEALAEREERALVDRVLTQLSRRDQRFVELYFGSGESPERIASSMGISLSTVYSKKAKIKARLGELVLAELNRT
ncbi:MAG: sigma-70 family RNA polymerase sigma factor [Myxococcota bacterium]